MRILFVDNLLLESSSGSYKFDLQPHLGLISLIAVAESAGHEGLLYDPKLALSRGELPLDESLYKEIATALLSQSPDVVGLTTLGCNFICTLKVAAYLKTMNPDLPILLGGPHATILDRQIMERFPQFDVVVRNEAEDILLPLLDALPQRRFANIAGITFRSGNEVVANPGSPLIADLDALPRAAYHSYPIEELNLPVLRVEAGRGCPFNCTFCSTASFFGRKYRLKSAAHLCAELDSLHSQYGISHFALTHDLFTVSKAKVREFCDAVEDRGYTWTCSARMDCVDAELLQRMYKAGCRSIYYGVETGSRRMQKIVEKRLDLDLFTPTLDATRRVGMAAIASFITGYPEEEQSDQDDTLDMIGSCFSRYREGLTIQLHLLTPEPGTRLIHEFADALAYDGHISDFNFPTLEADDGDIMRQNPEVFMNHHYYEAVLPRQRHLFVTSVHPVLYQLGFPVMAHILRYYDGKLSYLHSQMYKWAEQISYNGPYDENFVCDFIEHDLGRDHYLTSLVRYTFAAIGLRRRMVQAQGVPLNGKSPIRLNAAQATEMYTLAPGVAVLRDLHNGPEIYNLIMNSDTPQDVEIHAMLHQQRSHYLLLFEPTTNATVRNFELDEASADLIEYFTVPHTYQQYLREFRTASATPKVPRTFFDELLQMHILHPAKEQGLRGSDGFDNHRMPSTSRIQAPIAMAGSQRTSSSGC